MSVIDTLITDRTQEDVDALEALLAEGINPADHRGAYNASDLNRVGTAVDYLRIRLEAIGCPDDGVIVDYQFSTDNVTIVPFQAGRGDPAPDNIRQISPGLMLHEIGDIYGGTLDVLAGTLTADKIGKEFNGTETWLSAGSGTGQLFRYVDARSRAAASGRSASHFANATITTSSTAVGYYAYTSGNRTDTYVQFRPDLSQITDVTGWKAWLAEQHAAGTPLTCWWTAQDPQVYTLTERQINEAARQIGDRIVSLMPETMAKTDWNISDIPTQSQMENYLSAVAAIRKAVLDYRPKASLPGTIRRLDWQGANKIEMILTECETVVRRVMLSYRGYSGRLRSGVNCLP